MQQKDGLMTKNERIELAKVVRMKGKVAIKNLQAAAATAKADVERQLAQQFDPQHKLWQQIVKDAAAYVAQADAKIAEQCRKLGVAENLRPSLSVDWEARGESANKYRRWELKTAAFSKIDSQVAQGNSVIELWVMETCTNIIEEGLTTHRAKQFLDSLPTPEQMLPPISLPQLNLTIKSELENIEEGDEWRARRLLREAGVND